MLEKIIEKIFSNFPNIKEEKLLLAVSGGIDSMVMLDIFMKIGAQVDVVHCNFRLRGAESDGDEKFVVDYCKKNSINYYVEQFETKSIAENFKLSIQEMARELRYNLFYNLSEEYFYDKVLTAHNLNDSFETFIINLSRGTGIDGLLGIPIQNKNFIRPINFLTREEIFEYANLYNIEWREDSSNKENNYLRNKIRHQLTPFFEEINPSFFKSFSKTLNNLNHTKILEREELDTSFLHFLKQNKKNEFVLNIEYFLENIPNVSAYLYGWYNTFGFKDWVAIENLLYAETGKIVEGTACYLIKDKKSLVLKFKNVDMDELLNNEDVFLFNHDQDFINFGVTLSKEIVTKENKSTLNKIYVDQDSLKFPLVVRKFRKGDNIFPSKMDGSKKVSKFFKDQKMSLFEIESTYLLTTFDDQVIWIIGHRTDRRFEVNKNTKTIIKFEIK